MPNMFMEQCLNSTELKKYVHHFAYKVRSKYPRYMDTEDVENELWLHVFKAISTRYTEGQSLFIFAKQAVFSKYGNLIKDRSNASRLLNERATSLSGSVGPWIGDYDRETDIPVYDPQYTYVEAVYTLEQIENDLKKRQEGSRQYYYAVKQFRYFREGKSMKEFCKDSGLSRPYGYFIFSKIIKKCAEKYAESGIPIGGTNEKTTA